MPTNIKLELGISFMRKLFDRLFPLAVIVLFGLLILTIIRSSIFGYVAEDKHIYFEIVFLLLLAVIGELAVTRLKQPSVMLLMLLGMLMSPSFLTLSFNFIQSFNLPFPSEPPNILRFDEVINVFAQLGAIILLFKVGMHSKIESVFSKENVVVATAGVILPFAVGYLYAATAGGNFAYSMFLGAALTATSVGVTVAFLKEMNLVKERFAQVIIGAAVIDDILGLLVLSFVINVSGGADSSSLMPLLQTFASAILFLVGGVFAGKLFIGYLDRKEMGSRRLMLVLAFMLFYAYISEFIQLSAIVGAFLAGIILNQSRHIKQIEESTYGLEVLFTPIFFITMGMLIDVNSLYVYVIPIIIITVLAILTKVMACYLASLASNLSSRDSLLVGIGMVPRGEVALIVASIGLTKGVLDVTQYSIISAMALLTTFVVPPILNYVLKRN